MHEDHDVFLTENECFTDFQATILPSLGRVIVTKLN